MFSNRIQLFAQRGVMLVLSLFLCLGPALGGDEAGRPVERDPSWVSYLAHIGAAEASLRLNDVGAVKRWLASAPEKHRDWEWRYLSAQADQSLGVLTQAEDTVLDIAFSPDGSRCALACANGVVHIHKTDDGAQHLRFSAHEGGTFRTAFSPDGKQLATVGRDNTARIFDAETGKETLAFRGHEKPVTSVAFNRAGDRVATSSYIALKEAPYVLGTILIWDPKTGEVTSKLTGGQKPISRIRFSPDEKLVAAATWDGQIDIWEVDKPERTRTLKVPDEGRYTALNGFDFSPDGEHIAAGSKDHTARVWNMKSGELVATLKHDGWVTAVTYSPDGSHMATASHDNLIRLWDAKSFSLISILRGHTGGPWAVEFSRDGKRLYSAGVDREVRVWDATCSDYGNVRRDGSSGCYATKYAGKSGKLLTCEHDGSVSVWETTDWKRLNRWTAHEGNTANTLSISRDGSRAATCSWDKSVKVWNVETGGLLATVSSEFGVYHVAMSPDGKLIAGGVRGHNAIMIWNGESGELVRKLEGFEKGTSSGEFSPDGTRLVFGSSDRTAKVWDVASGKVLQALGPMSAGVSHATFSADGKLICACDGTGTVTLWESANGKRLWSSQAGNAAINRIAFSPDGRRIAAGGEDGYLLDVATGELVMTLRIDQQTIWDLSFSPDGSQLATGSTNGDLVVLETVKARK